MDIFNQTGVVLKTLRLSRNVSQLDLELSIGASTGSISRIENGKVNPSKETLFSISEVLGLNFLEKAELLGLQITEDEIFKLLNKKLQQKSVTNVSLH